MRSKTVYKKVTTPDPVYHHPLVTKLVNGIMHNGKKTVAQKQIYLAMEILKTQAGSDPLQQYLTALDNLRPQMEVRARRIGGAAYQVPSPVRGVRQDSLAIRWLIMAARLRPSTQYHNFGEKLAAEITEAVNNAGGAVKKKLDMHRMAEANKAFAHFRW